MGAVVVGAGADLIRLDPDGALVVRGLDARHIGELAAHAGIALWELSPQTASLEDAFRELTHDHRDFTASPAALPDADPDLGSGADADADADADRDLVPVAAAAAPSAGTR